MSAAWLCALLATAAAALAVPGRAVVTPATGPGEASGPSGASGDQVGAGWMLRYRPLWSMLAAAGAVTVVGGVVGVAAGVAAAVTCWVGIGRAEPAARRAEREAMQRDLPHVVRLLGSALAAGASPVEALGAVAAALPGPGAERLARVAARLRLGADPAEVWRTLSDEPALAPLGRALVRAQTTGAPVVATVARLADDLARHARAEVEDRARAVGVKAALPLGLCLLPAFVLIGIVPLVGGLMGELTL